MIALDEIIKSFLNKSKKYGFDIKPSEGLISPYFEGDFNQSAATQFIVPILISDKEEVIQRISIVERCLRRSDLRKVSLSDFHLLFFEMGVIGILGNLKQSLLQEEFKGILNFSIEWFVKNLGLDKSKLLFTVCREAKINGEFFPKDRVSIDSLMKVGIKKSQIQPLKGRSNILLSRGNNRPVGYSVEILYRQGKRYIELASANICTQILKDNKLISTKNVACGSAFGFERIFSIVNGYDSIFELEIYQEIIKYIRDYFRSNREYELVSERIYMICELIRSIAFIIEEGQIIDKSGRGQFLKQLIKRLGSEMDYLNLPIDLVLENSIKKICSFYENRHPLLMTHYKEIAKKVKSWITA